MEVLHIPLLTDRRPRMFPCLEPPVPRTVLWEFSWFVDGSLSGLLRGFLSHIMLCRCISNCIINGFCGLISLKRVNHCCTTFLTLSWPKGIRYLIRTSSEATNIGSSSGLSTRRTFTLFTVNSTTW